MEALCCLRIWHPASFKDGRLIVPVYPAHSGDNPSNVQIGSSNTAAGETEKRLGWLLLANVFQDRQELLSRTPPGHGAESGSRSGEKSVGGAGQSAKDGRK